MGLVYMCSLFIRVFLFGRLRGSVPVSTFSDPWVRCHRALVRVCDQSEAWEKLITGGWGPGSKLEDPPKDPPRKQKIDPGNLQYCHPASLSRSVAIGALFVVVLKLKHSKFSVKRRTIRYYTVGPWSLTPTWSCGSCFYQGFCSYYVGLRSVEKISFALSGFLWFLSCWDQDSDCQGNLYM
jgi:hypothetical protein